MFELIAAMALAADAPAQQMQAALDAYESCVRKNALAWAKGPDAARDIVAAAIARCGSEENAATSAFVGEPPTGADAVALQKFRYRQTLFDGLMEGVERRALALVIEARAVR